MSEKQCTFHSLDGTRLNGDFVSTIRPLSRSVLLVHGAGVDRHEDGFYDRALDIFRAAGFGVFRFDLRGHGLSDGMADALDLAGALNDIVAAWLRVAEFTGAEPTCALGSSFGGGLLALAATRLKPKHLVFINPLLKFRKRFLEDKAFWSERGLSGDAREQLQSSGALPHVGSILMSKAFINEVMWLDPFDMVDHISADVLVCHGTRDSRAPYAVAREWSTRIAAELVTFDGAEHGLCVPDDDDFSDPQTLAWQGEALTRAAEWCQQG